uniref:Natural cytotoxicity triggering receptor 3 ligand 1-like n=1 Tax=Callorhinchus milii TaxID=7868 RepID=A0A4W3GKA0_CALMI
MALKVMLSPQMLKTAVGTNVTINCDFVPDAPVEPQFLLVSWKRNNELVISYFKGGIRVSRVGTRFAGELAKGKAALFLPEVGIEDQGDYECTVIASPDEGSATCTLRISASPSVPPVGPLLELKPGFRRSLRCEASGFYPEEISILWFKISTVETLQEMTGQEIQRGNPVRNSDGTFSAVNVLTLRAPPVVGGDSYICHVRHEASETLVKQRVTITVTGSLPWYSWFSITCAVILLMALLVMFIIIKYKQLVDLPLCLKCFSKVKVQILLQPAEALQGQFTSGICSFRGCSLQARKCVLAIRKNDVETQVLERHYGREDSAENRLKLLEDSINHFTALGCPELSPNIFISFPADAKKHDRAEFVYRVIETRTQRTWEASTGFTVIGVPQDIQLLDPGPVKHGDHETLICTVTRFSPKALTVKWGIGAKGIIRTFSEESYGPPEYKPSVQRIRFAAIEYEIKSPEYTENNDRTVSCSFGLAFQVDVDAHDQREFLCEINHETLDSPLKKRVCMTVTRGKSLSFRPTLSLTPETTSDQLLQQENW